MFDAAPDRRRLGSPESAQNVSHYPADSSAVVMTSSGRRFLSSGRLTRRSVGSALRRFDLRGKAATGSFALADEFLFAASQLILNVALARWLTPLDYGAFTIAYTAFLLLGTAHTSLLTEPLMVFGSSKYKSCFAAYLGLLVRAHLIFAAFLGCLLIIAGVFVASSAPALSTALVYLGGGCPLLLLPWLLRRACYVRRRAQKAAIAGGVYAVCLLAGLLSLADAGVLSIRSALLLLAGASAAASLFILRSFGAGLSDTLPSDARREILIDHWKYGRWALPSAFLTWFPGSIYYFLVPQLAGVRAAGALRAIMNLVAPVLHSYAAFSMVLLPGLSATDSTATLRSGVRRALPVYLLPAVAYCGVVVFSHREIFRWFYAGQYSDVSSLLSFAAPMVVAVGATAVYTTGLRAVQRPDCIFWSYAFASGTSLTVGVLLTLRYQLLGAVLGLTLSHCIGALVARFNFARVTAAAKV